jgi:SWI/SNF-related matrix-associated actin-dependent regulator 1 of chromatin subfamily A
MGLFPYQEEGARFLAGRSRALLADAPGLGKTAQAIRAADLEMCDKIVVVTTASARINWEREFIRWQAWPRRIQVIHGRSGAVDPKADVVIVGWAAIAHIFRQLRQRIWDLLILDESHYAKNARARRTMAVWGTGRTGAEVNGSGLEARCARIWCLSGTPMPNFANDLWPMMAGFGLTKLKAPAWQDRYCVTRPMMQGGSRAEIVVANKNLPELKALLAPAMLRRRPDEVLEEMPEIRYSVVTLDPGALLRDIRDAEAGVDVEAVVAAAEAGATSDLDMHLGPLRRLTGTAKARAVVDMVDNEIDGLKKIVLFAWHRDVLAILSDGLSQHGVVGIDGSTPPDIRQEAVDRFQNDPAVKVFIGQIQAAGEAITLTAAHHALFVEPSFVPKDMAQAAKRIHRIGQTRPCFVRVAALAGSLDEALMTVLVRKTADIRTVLD